MEKKQRILIVHNYYQIAGGEDRVVENEIRLLRNHGHKVFFYHRHNDEIKKARLLKKIAYAGASFFNPKTYFEIRKIIKTKKIDIVHVHNTLSLISPAVYYAAFSCKVPVVQTVHNFRLLCPGATLFRDGKVCEECIKHSISRSMKHSCYKNSFLYTLICALNTMFNRKIGTYRRINFLFLTEFNKQKFLEVNKKIHFLDEKRLFTKPNFSFSNERQCIKKKSKNYLYVGRIEEIKGIELLISAFGKMPDRNLYLVGDGPLLEKYKERVAAHQNNNIVFGGRIDHQSVLDEMEKANAVILPSIVYEGFPMIIPEAFSTHTPVIVSNLGNNNVLVEDEITGTKFDCHSEEAFIDAVNRLEELDYEMVCENCYKTYLSRFSMEENYVKLKSVYDQAKK